MALSGRHDSAVPAVLVVPHGSVLGTCVVDAHFYSDHSPHIASCFGPVLTACGHESTPVLSILAAEMQPHL